MITALAPAMRAITPTDGTDVAALVEVCERIDAMAGDERAANLLAFARSPWWRAPIALAEGASGRITREAARVLTRELAAVTPGRIWAETPYAHKRNAVARALRVDPAERFSGYATAPFRIVQTAEDEHWIAGAVGCTPDLKGAEAALAWCHLDIEHVILWNPRSNELRAMGESRSATTIVMPSDNGDRLTVYADGYAFFRDWADARASVAAAHLMAKQQGWSVVHADAPDSSIPGALVIGDLAKVRWAEIGASVLVAGPGVDPKTLDRAVWRSARLPRVEASPDQRRAA